METLSLIGWWPPSLAQFLVVESCHFSSWCEYEGCQVSWYLIPPWVEKCRVRWFGTLYGWGRGAFWHPPLKEENSGISLLHSPFLSQIIPSANKAHFPFSFHSVTIIWLVKHWQDIVTLCYMNALARLCQAQWVLEWHYIANGFSRCQGQVVSRCQCAKKSWGLPGH